MFSWFGIVNGIVSVVNKVATYFTNKQLIDSGVSQQQAADTKSNTEQRKTANAVQNTVNASSDADIDKLSDKWTRS